jgi:hypothetical protein
LTICDCWKGDTAEIKAVTLSKSSAMYDCKCTDKETIRKGEIAETTAAPALPESPALLLLEGLLRARFIGEKITILVGNE